MKTDVIKDQTSAANSVLDTGGLDLSDYDAISIDLVASAAGAAGGPSLYVRPNGAGSAVGEYQRAGNGNLVGAWTLAQMAWGPGCGGGASYGGMNNYSGPLPPALRITVPAQGAGITSRIIITGRRRAS